MKYSDNNTPLICLMTQSTCYRGTRPMQIKGVLWHSTGCNNPNISRYVQPDDNAPNRMELIEKIGRNSTGGDWNHIDYRAGVNAWIGRLADGSVAAVQTLPWNFKPWGCGSGRYGSCNEGWIQFEICEDNLNNPAYFEACYKEACELTAYLCKKFNINPLGTTTLNGKQIPTILCHADSCSYGVGSNHADVLHWFPKYGKNMATARADVAALLENEDDENMTSEKFDELMKNWIAEQAKKEPAAWSLDAREWAEKNGFIEGDGENNKMYKKYLTREEFVTVLHRIIKKLGLLR